MKQTIQEISDQILHSPFIVGFAGALVGVFVRGKLPFITRASMVIAGIACAGYITPAVALWFGMVSPEYFSAIAFAIGLTGLQVTGGLIKLGEDIRKNPHKYIPRSWKK